MRLDEGIIIEKLNSITEDKMTEEIILPLYQKKFKGKYFDIEFTGGKKGSEQGCDIIYYEITHDTKAKEYSGIQVKQGNIDSSKKQTGIAAISIQAEQAFMKEINNTNDKTKYYIKTYIILTTGEILPTARATITDHFAQKNIRFINGKEIVQWIIEIYYDEFIDYFKIKDDDTENDDDSTDPCDIIIDYLMLKYSKEIRELKKSFQPYGSRSNASLIIRYLLENGTSKPYTIARGIEINKEYVEEKISELIGEEIIQIAEDGVFVESDYFTYYSILRDKAEKRIEQLGYSVDEIIDSIMTKIIEN
jgi:hypothetical protein